MREQDELDEVRCRPYFDSFYAFRQLKHDRASVDDDMNLAGCDVILSTYGCCDEKAAVSRLTKKTHAVVVELERETDKTGWFLQKDSVTNVYAFGRPRAKDRDAFERGDLDSFEVIMIRKSALQSIIAEAFRVDANHIAMLRSRFHATDKPAMYGKRGLIITRASVAGSPLIVIIPDKVIDEKCICHMICEYKKEVDNNEN